MSSPPLPNHIPVRVFLVALQEYSAYLCQWQAHAEAESREVHSLRDRIAELEKENEEMRDCRDILQRMVDTQRELVASLETDLARVAECHFSPCACACDLSGASSSSMSSPVLDLGPSETSCYPAAPLLCLVDPAAQPLHKRQADVELASPSKRLHREESGDTGLELAELLRN